MTKYDRQKAIEFALAQQGKPYIFGSYGPAGFDCSGLTMESALHGGIQLPHNAGQQAETLGAVPFNKHNLGLMELADFLFYYGSVQNPASITHVVILVRKTRVFHTVMAAVDEEYGVIKHRMRRFLNPIGIGYVGHRPVDIQW